MDNKEGVWRTIRGRRVFIAKGESLGQAMAKSGKFKREDIREGKRELSFYDTNRKNLLSKNYNEKKAQKRINKFHSKYYDKPYKEQVINNNFKDNQAEKNKIHEEEKPLKTVKTRVLRNLPKYSKSDENELKHELVQKKLAEYRKKKGIKTSITSEEYNKKLDDAYKELGKTRDYDKYYKTTDDIMDNYTTPRMNKEQVEKSNKKAIEDYKAKKQSNNKIDDDTYKFKESYKSYHEKMQSHGDREKWSAKEYTNDEFMEHLTDSNWHKERKMIEEANLTNKQLTELKNQITVSKWGVENFDYNNAKEMIDKVKQSNNIFQPTKEDLKEMQTYDRANDIRPELSNNKVEALSQVKVKGEENVIPRDFKKSYGKFKVETTANKGNKDDRFEITKDESGWHAKNLRTGETYATFREHLSNNNVFEFENTNNKQETIKNYVEKKQSNNVVKSSIPNSTINHIKTQKQLKELVNDNAVKDITNNSWEANEKLRKKTGKLEKVKVTHGTYGINGALLKDNKGNYYVITTRNTNIDYWI